MFTKVKNQNKQMRERSENRRQIDVSNLNDEEYYIYQTFDRATATVGGVEFVLYYDPYYRSITARPASGEYVSYSDRDAYRNRMDSFLRKEMRDRGVVNIPSIYVEF